jgi:hypothetical protein
MTMVEGGGWIGIKELEYDGKSRRRMLSIQDRGARV